MRAVAERSGENLGSIHYHFGSKDALFEEVVKSAIADFKEQPSWSAAAGLEVADATPEKLSQVIREIVHQQICMLFNPEKPRWHAPVIYQLLQYEGPLCELFAREVLNPEIAAMRRLFKIVNPEMDGDEILLHTLILNMPIFSHANYMTTILKLLNTSQYSDEYLQRLEDLLVRQTQLLLGLPVDEELKGTI
ncbi:MAG: helix-turn-helix transcriptional regulator [Verrucomicrobia bacterium]|nr:helix-turn-helix transcriptional regulator [Verrucomicrobiota bacterium]